jgi:hypothetical protein
MRDSVGEIFVGTAVTLFSGNRFQAGSRLFVKRAAAAPSPPILNSWCMYETIDINENLRLWRRRL